MQFCVFVLALYHKLSIFFISHPQRGGFHDSFASSFCGAKSGEQIERFQCVVRKTSFEFITYHELTRSTFLQLIRSDVSTTEHKKKQKENYLLRFQQLPIAPLPSTG